jgi:hypothetical protein
VTKLLLTIHVLAAIIAIGPVTVAASMFPAAARRADLPTLRTLHRITRVYAALAVVIPVFGLATAQSLGVLTDPWLLTSIALTVLAAAVLALQVLPRQARLLAATTPSAENPDHSPASPAMAARLGAATGTFNLLWAIVVVLMIVRPGSTTGA